IGGKLDLLITLKDNKAKDKSGRIYLDEIANKHTIPLLKINNVNDPEVIEMLTKYDIDWLFIIGWSQIAKKQLLDTPKKGCIGMHPTLLPIGRGRAAIPWAIIKGLDKTGVTMFKLNEGVDTGDIIAQGEIKLDNKITATELYDMVNAMHSQLIRDNWFNIIENKIHPTKQDERLATEWPGRRPEDGEINGSMTMIEAHTLVRATTHPYPGAFFDNENNKIIIWKADMNPTHGDIKLKDGYLDLIEYEVLYYEE
ncbi:MAG: formyltransferase family protein, partial [Acholeplasma sp.]|nr:formyltransferase family protein [Acholeplasma sp.]